MGRLNKNLIDQDILIQVEGRLFNALSRRDPGELEAILRGLLTEPELEMLGKRVTLLKMLSEGVSHHLIADKLKLSTTTISQTNSKLRYNKSLQKLVADLVELG